MTNSGAEAIIQTASEGAISTISFLSTANQKSVMQLLMNVELTRQMRKHVWPLYLGERKIHQQQQQSFRWLDHVSKFDVLITQTAERLVKLSCLTAAFTSTKVTSHFLLLASLVT